MGNREEVKMIYSAVTIADEILKIAKRREIELTPLQLMKLVYISHGWSFPIRKSDLFTDRIEAWRYGPVIPDLYHATKQFGRQAIPFSKIRDDLPSAVDPDTQRFLENVFEQYGRLSGFALSSLTHKRGTPWEQVYEDGMFGIEIPDSVIRDHYMAKFNEQQSSSTA